MVVLARARAPSDRVSSAHAHDHTWIRALRSSATLWLLVCTLAGSPGAWPAGEPSDVENVEPQTEEPVDPAGGEPIDEGEVEPPDEPVDDQIGEPRDAEPALVGVTPHAPSLQTVLQRC